MHPGVAWTYGRVGQPESAGWESEGRSAYHTNHSNQTHKSIFGLRDVGSAKALVGYDTATTKF